MSQIKSRFKRWTGSAWVEYYFKTSADLIDETASYKVMTSAERDAIGTYLTNGFNDADLLVKINGEGSEVLQDPGKIDRSLIGDLSGTYLTKADPAFSGDMTGAGDISVDGDLNALWNDAGSVFQFQVNDSQGGFTLDASDGAQLKLDQGATFNTAVTVGTPTATGHATTKEYVDGLIAEGVKPFAPVKAASTTNIATLSGTITLDGTTLVTGDRILLKNQTTVSQNGIYTYSSTGAWTKVTEESILGALVFVENGTINNDSKFYAQTATTWILFSRTDTITASTGLTKVGTDIRVAAGEITNDMLAGSITLAKLASFTSLDNANASYDTWAELTAAATSENIDIKLKNLYAAIGLLRGTANYNTNNTETIAGAFDLAEVKNRTFTFTTATPLTGTGEQFEGQTFVTGDLYFQELAT
jgi:hypothetical protein